MYRIFAIGAALFAMHGTAHATTVNFDGLTVASQLTTFDFGNGLTGTVSAEGVATNNPDAAVVFDTEATGTADPDLQSSFALAGSSDASLDRDFGNAIIVQENPAVAGVFTPDDDGQGGVLDFAFDGLISLDEVYLLDAYIGTSVALYDGDTVVSTLTTLINADTGNNTSNNQYTFLDFGGAIGDRFVVDFNGRSGGLGEFAADALPAVPVPASLPLLLAGFSAFGFVSRRKASSKS